MNQRAKPCYNSVLARKDAESTIGARGRLILKATHVFSYAWDYTAGHFPNMINLIQSAGMEISGFSSDKADALESRSRLLAVQKRQFGSSHNLIDVNALMGKDVLDTRDVFKFFATQKIIDKSLILAAGNT